MQQTLRANAQLFDQLIGAREQQWWHGLPRALAVLRLIVSSYLVGCSTGRSAGLAPFENLVYIDGSVAVGGARAYGGFSPKRYLSLSRKPPRCFAASGYSS